MTTVSVTTIVTCKGRLDHVRKSWPSWRNQVGVDHRICLVDYGCPDGAFAWAIDLDDPFLFCVRVESGTDQFNLSRARNFGAAMTPDPIFAFVDADVILDRHFLSGATYAIRAGTAVYTYPGWQRAGRGICCVRADVFNRISGFDELMEGWGAEDVDLAKRAEPLGNQAKFAPAFKVTDHGDNERVAFYRQKNKQRSNQDNMNRMNTRRDVNPLGFATGPASLYIPGQGITQIMRREETDNR